MSVKEKIKNIDSKNEQVRRSAELFLMLLDDLKNELLVSIELSKTGHDTKFFKYLKKASEDPLNISSVVFDNISFEIKDIVKKIVIIFLKNNKDKIKEVFEYKTNDNNLFFVIRLKNKDDVQFFENFVNNYELKYKISRQFQIFFNYIFDDVDLEKKCGLKKINL